MTTLIHIFAFLSILTFPLYLFSSGGLQVSHLCFGCFLLLFGNKALNVRHRLPAQIRRALGSLGMFVAYVCVVQGASAVVYQDGEFLLYGSFYIFNLLYVCAFSVYLLVHGQQASKAVFLGAAAAVGLALFGALIGYSGGGARQSSFFNNPNQLGYFGIISLTLMLTFHTSQTYRYSRMVSLLAAGAAVYLCVVSLSKAAMLAAVVTIFLFVPLFSRRELAVIVGAIVITAPLWTSKVVESDQYDNAARRIDHVGQDHDDNFASRGYARIARFPDQLIFGAGEGRFLRFGSELEIHATFANILFSYGIPGALLFIGYLVRCLRISPLLFIVMLAPAFAYGLTHNGVRSSYFWLLMAVYMNVALASGREPGRLGMRGALQDAYGALRRQQLAGAPRGAQAGST